MTELGICGTILAMLGDYHLDSIVCGDAAILLAGLPDDCIDLTVTSPPYDDLRDYEGYSFDAGIFASS